MVVLSDGRRIALAAVVRAEALKSEACIVELHGDVRAGDRVRLVQRPDIPISVKGYLLPNVHHPGEQIDPSISLPPSARIRSTRARLLEDFLPEGGISSPARRTYLLKDRRSGQGLRRNGLFVRIVVDFRPDVSDMGRQASSRLEELPDDVIIRISGPYLSAGMIVD